MNHAVFIDRICDQTTMIGHAGFFAFLNLMCFLETLHVSLTKPHVRTQLHKKNTTKQQKTYLENPSKEIYRSNIDIDILSN